MIRRRRGEAQVPASGGDVLNVRDPLRGALDVGRGETVVLLGATGEGKTTWLHSMLGVHQPFERTLAFGRPLTRARLGEVLAWVPQTDGVFLSETVWENVTQPRRPGRSTPEHAADALDLVGLADRADEPVSHLGLGARRRVAFACAVARRRPFLVVDGELDPTVQGLWPEITSRMPWLEGILVATAVAGDLAWRADSVALLRRGVVVAQAPLAMLQDSLDPEVRSVMAWVTP